ncbi:hypothetical protein RJ640_001668 [Escallonia rubra]|uniref:Bet v I/Major latex protein domain-containing protein n=1 Tax=Escallonia rubra TaxID=112253 RepID=A0AA88RSH0_9ASTE|nr:hypothetical protein RJ640_001668 [Escallonia rubra]
MMAFFFFILSPCEIIDGKARPVKEIIDGIDEKNKTVIFRVIEGNLLELYKSSVFILHVDTKGANNLVTWTIEYEKQSEDIEDPNTLMDLLVNLTKDIETPSQVMSETYQTINQVAQLYEVLVRII